MNNLGRIDLNLLVILHALLQEKHISRAAVRLHKSQPAVSHSLAHLRQLFDDPLLIRRAGKLELTARASELMPPLTVVLGQLGALFNPDEFDPAREQRTFRLVMSDYAAQVLLPGLVRFLRAAAPGIELIVSQASREAMLTNLHEGESDMAFGVFPGNHSGELRSHTLFVEDFACLADAATLPESGGLNLDDWLARPHVLVAMRSGSDSEIDLALSREGLKRRIAIVLPHWGAASALIAGTDLVLTVARRSLDAVASDSRIGMFEPPLVIAPFEFKLVWHQRREGDPAHRWLRETIMRIAESKQSIET